MARRVLTAAQYILVALVAFSFAFTPLRASQDEWWHLKTGQWILEHGRLPHNDIFTYTGENIRWYNHEWLSQIIFYSVYAVGERVPWGAVRMLVLFKALVVALTFVRVARLAALAGAKWPIAVLIGVTAAEISRRTIYTRPPIFSYLIFTEYLILLYKWKLGHLRMRWLWILPAVIVVWSNLHGMCLLGVVAVGAFAAGEILERLFHPAEGKRTLRGIVTPEVRHLILLTLVTMIAAMANPAGYHTYLLGSRFTDDPLLKLTIAEMLPTPFFLRRVPVPGGTTTMFVPGFATFWIAAALLIVLLLVNRLRLRTAADYLLVAFFLYQAVMHWRLLPLFAIASAFPLAYLILARLRTERAERIAQPVLALIALALSVFFVFFNREPRHTFFERNRQLLMGHTMDPHDYPEPLMRFIEQAKLPGRMFSQVNYCGYAMWRLSPEDHKLFTDNRFDVFGGEFHRLETIIVEALEPGDTLPDKSIVRESWRDILNRYGVNFASVTRDIPLNNALRRDGWKLVFVYNPPGSPPDAGYNVWLRNSSGFTEAEQRATALYRRMFPQ